MQKEKNFKRLGLAFTLAEVLITIVIIGVVAAITIPNISADHRKKQLEARLLKFYSTMQRAIRLSEAYNGTKDTWDELGSGFVTDDDGNTQSAALSWYNKYLKNYLVVMDVKAAYSGKLMIYFTDGSLALFSSASILFVPAAKDFLDWDEETFSNNDNLRKISGRRMFTFYFDSDYGVEPYTYNWDGERETLFTNSKLGCNRNATNHQAYCTQLIKLNGWKIPDDYPFGV